MKTPVEKLSDNLETKFVVPKFANQTSAALQQDFLDIPEFPREALCPLRRDLPSFTKEVLSHFEASSCTFSSRFEAVIDDALRVRKEDPFAKFVIFSQHADSLKAMQTMFSQYNARQRKRSSAEENSSEMEKKNAFNPVLVDLSSGGAKTVEGSLWKFNSDPHCDVCLLTTGSSAAGLTLSVARVCYMLEPLQNAAEEAQALGRIHRISQKSSVRCVIFYAQHTFEERLLALRKKQKTLTELLADPGYFGNEVPSGDSGSDEETGALSAAQARKRKTEAKRRKGVGLLGTTHFTSTQMEILCGLTEKRRNAARRITEAKNSSRSTRGMGIKRFSEARSSASSSSSSSSSSTGLTRRVKDHKQYSDSSDYDEQDSGKDRAVNRERSPIFL